VRVRAFLITTLVAAVACGASACAGRASPSPVTSPAAAPAVAQTHEVPTPKYRLAARKHADDAPLCELFSSAELADILDSTPRTKPSGPFCTITAKTSTGDRVIVVTVDSARLDDYAGHTGTKSITVGGNSAEQYPSDNGGCVVTTVLTDDAAALNQTLVVTLDPISGNVHACSLARRVSSLVFHKLH
jgi:hypothetical protein